MSARASQITCASIVNLPDCSAAVKIKHKNSSPLAFVRGNHRWLVDSPHKEQVKRMMFPFDDVIMVAQILPGCGNVSRRFGQPMRSIEIWCNYELFSCFNLIVIIAI